MDIGQFICEKDLMKNFKAASALQRKLICESLCSLCCPESIWGEEEEELGPRSYCQVYHMWVSQDINIPRQPKALEQAVFRWSPLVWASVGQFGRKTVCLQFLELLTSGSQPLMVSSKPGYPKTKPHLSCEISAFCTITKSPCLTLLSFSIWIPAHS